MESADGKYLISLTVTFHKNVETFPISAQNVIWAIVLVCRMLDSKNKMIYKTSSRNKQSCLFFKNNPIKKSLEKNTTKSLSKNPHPPTPLNLARFSSSFSCLRLSRFSSGSYLKSFTSDTFKRVYQLIEDRLRETPFKVRSITTRNLVEDKCLSL